MYLPALGRIERSEDGLIPPLITEATSAAIATTASIAATSISTYRNILYFNPVQSVADLVDTDSRSAFIKFNK